MLALRPNCRCCDRDLSPESGDALICSFKYTFCSDGATTVLGRFRRNCGGELVRRPIPRASKLVNNPASTIRVFKAEGCQPVKAA